MLTMDFTDLKDLFEAIYNIWLNEPVIKVRLLEEKIMLTYLNMMIDELNNIVTTR